MSAPSVRLRRHLVLAAVAAALLARCGSPTRPSGGGPVVFVGAGDIANLDTLAEGAEATAKLIEQIPGTVFTAGDNAYPGGSSADFFNAYHPTWGRFKDRTWATPGNHDFDSPTNGRYAYFDYFTGRAGPDTRGYYSITLGAWTIISLNSETDASRGSPQWTWLRSQLGARGGPRTLSQPAGRCTLAIWHRPLYSSGGHGNTSYMRDIWQLLYDAGADVVITGHDHLYERFSPQDAGGQFDPVRGIREFVVGTGGGELVPPPPTVQPNSEKRVPLMYGVLKLTLTDRGYAWEFITTTAGTQDAGSDSCH